MLKFFRSLLLLVLLPLSAQATTYYVGVTGCSNSSADPTNPATPWCDLSRASGAASPTPKVVAGDTVTMLVGTIFNSGFTPVVSGTDASHYVTYQGSAAPTVGGVNAKVRSITISNLAYVKILNFELTNDGFTPSTTDRILFSGCDHCVISGNYLHDFTTNSHAMRSLTPACTNTLIQNNIIANSGLPGNRKSGISAFCNDTIISGNNISQVGDYGDIKGQRVVYRNNTWHDTYSYDSPYDGSQGNHIDDAQVECLSADTVGIDYLLFESNIGYNAVNTDAKQQQHFYLSNTSARCGGANHQIARYNATRDQGEAFWIQNCCTGSGEYGAKSKVYNNTGARTGYITAGAPASIGNATSCQTSNTKTTPTVAGSGYSVASNLATSGGSGTGLTVDITSVDAGGGVLAVVLHNSGSAYVASETPTIVQGGSDGLAQFKICGLEDTNYTANQETATGASFINNIMYDALTSKLGLMNGYFFGSGRATGGSVTVAGTGYVAGTKNVLASGSPCRSNSLKIDIDTVDGSGGITGFTIRAPGLLCTDGTVVTVSGGSGTAKITLTCCQTETNTGGYNMWYLTNNTSATWGSPASTGTNIRNHDPSFVSTTDLHLTAASTFAIDAGGPLTTVASGCGVGVTSFTATDASFFQDGWSDFLRANGIAADYIAVGTVGNTVQISSINYTSNVITLAGAITCSDLDNIWLYKNSAGTIVLTGSAPDVGAYEYDVPVPGNSGTITASAVTSSTMTLTWTKATDTIVPQANLTYIVYRSLSNNINTVANAQANGTVIMTSTADVNTFAVTGLNPSTSYYFNVLVNNGTNSAAYTTVNQATTALTPDSSATGRLSLRR